MTERSQQFEGCAYQELLDVAEGYIDGLPVASYICAHVVEGRTCGIKVSVKSSQRNLTATPRRIARNGNNLACLAHAAGELPPTPQMATLVSELEAQFGLPGGQTPDTSVK